MAIISPMELAYVNICWTCS